jgi:2-amino-4-hydroxy-6-hydroxymethyldihydropteridine diphosphokinase
MTLCLIGCGANLGDRAATLRAVVEDLRQSPGIDVVKVSRWHETAPVGGPAGQPRYLNGAVLLESSLSPRELLAVLQACEARFGRVRQAHWGARTIDLDLLLHGDQVCNQAELTLPHPRMAFRRFVLQPAAEVAPDLRHPTIGWTLNELLTHLDRAIPYLAITITAQDRTAAATLAAELAAAVAGRYLAGGRGAPDGPETPAGPLASGPLEWLDRWRRLLDRDAWSPSDALSPNDAWTIGDFWFDEVWVEARTVLPAARFAEFHRRWEEAEAAVVRPKLTVLLEDSGRTDAVRQAALVERFERPGHGPTIRIPHEERATAREELLAAIDAMRS